MRERTVGREGGIRRQLDGGRGRKGGRVSRRGSGREEGWSEGRKKWREKVKREGNNGG